jgi:hypothetical protein
MMGRLMVITVRHWGTSMSATAVSAKEIAIRVGSATRRVKRHSWQETSAVDTEAAEDATPIRSGPAPKRDSSRKGRNVT